jgi:hypothetical protein
VRGSEKTIDQRVALWDTSPRVDIDVDPDKEPRKLILTPIRQRYYALTSRLDTYSLLSIQYASGSSSTHIDIDDSKY